MALGSLAAAGSRYGLHHPFSSSLSLSKPFPRQSLALTLPLTPLSSLFRTSSPKLTLIPVSLRHDFFPYSSSFAISQRLPALTLLGSLYFQCSSLTVHLSLLPSLSTHHYPHVILVLSLYLAPIQPIIPFSLSDFSLLLTNPHSLFPDYSYRRTCPKSSGLFSFPRLHFPSLFLPYLFFPTHSLPSSSFPGSVDVGV